MNSTTSIEQVALIVEDEDTNRLILKTFLKKRGYKVIEARSGIEAIECFTRYEPHIIFMDVIMPEMDGYEATSRIKQLAGDHFIPVIFLTALSDEKTLARCVEAGGDDFLSKPYSFTVLSAKLTVMERIHSMHQTTRSLYSRMQRDEEIAKQVYSRAVVADNVALDRIRSLLKPASVFSGDLFLTAFAPSHDLHLLLGDFTGHGLAATLGALPTSEVFRSMTTKGYSPQQILYTINNKLNALLPTGMFLAAQFLKVDYHLDHISLINCGMPDCYLTDGKRPQVKQRISSTTLPLGITPDISYKDEIHFLPFEMGDRVILATDGVSEARNPAGEYFGKQRLINAISHCDECDFIIDKLAAELENFCENEPQDDDISVVEIPLNPMLLPDWERAQSFKSNATEQLETLLAQGRDDSIEFQLILRGTQIRHADPVPVLLTHIQETADMYEHRRPLFTILTELYVNALDHGILQLDSKLKQGENGFTSYFMQREQRLHTLTQGEICIGLRIHNLHSGGYIVIWVEDSGRGFDFTRLVPNEESNNLFSGRGIMLIKSLCKQLHYTPPGNKAEAIYVWSDNTPDELRDSGYY
jgi:serine phosphatase RsbU (regulator of sigma subunit)